MTKKHFIALADAIREHNKQVPEKVQFVRDHIETLCDFCRSQNINFNADRWLGYIAGECGPNGGKIK